jgi:hypothetical protein
MKKFINQFFDFTDNKNLVQKVLIAVLVFGVMYAISFIIIEIAYGFGLDFWRDNDLASLVLSVGLTAIIGIRLFQTK